MTSLSLVTTAWNRPQYCIDFVLESTLRQTELPNEVVIVDDGSVIDTAKIAVEKYKDKLNIKYVYNNNPGETTCSLSYNIGFKQASCDLLLIVSGDVIMSPDVVKSTKETLTPYKDGGHYFGHTTWGLTVQGTRKFQAVDPSTWYTKEFQDTLDYRSSWELEPHGEKARMGPTDIQGYYAQPKQGFPGYFCSGVSRKQILDIGGFDEDYSVMGGWNDYEFARRLELVTSYSWSNEVCYHLGHWHDTLDFYKPNHNPTWGVPAKRAMSSPPVITSPYTNVGREWGIIRK